MKNLNISMARHKKDQFSQRTSKTGIVVSTLSRHRKDGRLVGFLIQVNNEKIIFRYDYHYREVVENLYFGLTEMENRQKIKKGLIMKRKPGRPRKDGSETGTPQRKTVPLTRQRKERNLVYHYILDAIDPTSYEVTAESDIEKMEFLRDTFYKEYGWCAERIGKPKAFKEWIQGLPTAFNIAFMNCEIIQLNIQWGRLSESPTEKEEDKALAQYWDFIQIRVFELYRKLTDKGF